MDPGDVHTRVDLADFVRQLVADMQSNRGDWENPQLEDFLEPLSAWIDDMPGYFKKNDLPVPDRPDWSLFATMLLVARTYE
jgi:hypothetical protein